MAQWWEAGEYASAIGDTQAPPDMANPPGADLLGDAAATAEMIAAPLGGPATDFSIRSVYDSRPVNAYDFNYSQAVEVTNANGAGTTVLWAANFSAPNGYRAIPRKWDIFLDPPHAVGPPADSLVSITQSNAAIPNNQNIILGLGTDEPIETFFVCEENTVFGASGATSLIPADTTVNVNVNVHGNLIPVSQVAAPYSIANENEELS